MKMQKKSTTTGISYFSSPINLNYTKKAQKKKNQEILSKSLIFKDICPLNFRAKIIIFASFLTH